MGWHYPRAVERARATKRERQQQEQRRPGGRPLWDDLIDSMKTLGPSTPRELAEDIGATDLDLIRRTLRRMLVKRVAFVYVEGVNGGHGGRRTRRYAVRGKARRE